MHTYADTQPLYIYHITRRRMPTNAHNVFCVTEAQYPTDMREDKCACETPHIRTYILLTSLALVYSNYKCIYNWSIQHTQLTVFRII